MVYTQLQLTIDRMSEYNGKQLCLFQLWFLKKQNLKLSRFKGTDRQYSWTEYLESQNDKYFSSKFFKKNLTIITEKSGKNRSYKVKRITNGNSYGKKNVGEANSKTCV